MSGDEFTLFICENLGIILKETLKSIMLLVKKYVRLVKERGIEIYSHWSIQEPKLVQTPLLHMILQLWTETSDTVV